MVSKDAAVPAGPAATILPAVGTDSSIEPAAADAEEGPAGFIAAGAATTKPTAAAAGPSAHEGSGEASEDVGPAVAEVVEVAAGTGKEAAQEEAVPKEEEASSEESDADYAAVLERLAFLMSAPAAPATPPQACCSCPSCLAVRAVEDEVDEYGRQSVREQLLPSFDLQGVAELIKSGKARRIVCMCGAGISVSAGIPDFRTPGSGLYHKLEKYNLPYPQAVFEIDFFKANPRPFFLLAKELFPGTFNPTPTHYFMRLLHKKGLLLRCFTQNIDSLEHQAGLPKDAVVAAHGNFDSARCIRCGLAHSVGHVRRAVFAGEGSPCYCTKKGCRGLVKPDIVFFGENLPERFWQQVPEDLPKTDLLIVMGTSLVVQPFASLIDRVPAETPRVLINRERAGEVDPYLRVSGFNKGFNFDEGNYRDVFCEGDCDAGVMDLAKLLGWEEELNQLIEAGPPSEANL
ncbi:hypothetical protein N2152v2_006472 [Parachlorella kessleri]